jgi:hypothetical protein
MRHNSRIGADSSFNSKPGRATLVHRGNTPTPQESETTLATQSKGMQGITPGNSGAPGSPPKMAPKSSTKQAAPRQALQSSVSDIKAKLMAPRKDTKKRTASIAANSKIGKILGDSATDGSSDDMNGPKARKRVKKEIDLYSEDDKVVADSDHRIPPSIHVGHLKAGKGLELDDFRVQVRAYLTANRVLKYRLSEKEALESRIEPNHRKCPNQEQIDFLPTYQGTDREIRDAIKEKLKEMFPRYREKGAF